MAGEIDNMVQRYLDLETKTKENRETITLLEVKKEELKKEENELLKVTTGQ